MVLGIFSLSLAVTNMEKSLAFYSKLGFVVIDGGHMNSEFPDQGEMRWRILTHESLKIGLFQGMFDENIKSFTVILEENLKINDICQDFGNLIIDYG